MSGGATKGMPKTPEQPPITLPRKGEGPWSAVMSVTVPSPPEGCETQQLMDWAGVLAVFTVAGVDVPMKARVVEAYAERWGISTDG